MCVKTRADPAYRLRMVLMTRRQLTSWRLGKHKPAIKRKATQPNQFYSNI